MKPNRSENEILFDTTFDLLKNETHARGRVYEFTSSFYLNKGIENTENYSRDNFCGIYCWVKKFDPEYMKHLPLLDYFNFKQHHVLKPDWFFFFLNAKYPWIGWLFMPIVSLSMIIGAIRIKRNGVIHTSGLILSFIKFRAFKMPFTEWIINKRVNSYPELKGWDEVFRIYHQKDRLHIYEAFLTWDKKQ